MPELSRLLLLYAVMVAAPVLAGDADPLAKLVPEHPRVLVNSEGFRTIADRRRADPELDEVIRGVESYARSLWDVPPLERVVVGRRLLGVSRQAIERITSLALARHTTGDLRHAERAAEEMLAIAAFSDWNPSHFLDVAEMATALALGYDWLHDDFDAATRTAVSDALREKALDSLEVPMGWEKGTSNWNSVCFAGLTIAALAIADEEPASARRVLRRADANNPRAMGEFAPDGVYPEGMSYWVYGAGYQTLRFAALETALGDRRWDRWPNFARSLWFVVHNIGPTGKPFNFSDCPGRTRLSAGLVKMASVAERPEALAPFRVGGSLLERVNRRRLTALIALWWPDDRTAIGETPARSYFGGGHQPIAAHRERWDDPRAMYLAAKGGSATISHAHLDAGTFVYEADGVRWAIELGQPNYHRYESTGLRIWDGDPGGDRWRLAHCRNEFHNVPTLDGALFAIDGLCPIVAHSPLPDEGGVGETTIDLTPVYADRCAAATRRFRFDAAARSAQIADRFEGLRPGAEIAWTWMTRAKVAIDGATVELSQSGELLRLEQTGETAGEWRAGPVTLGEGVAGEPFPGVTVLRWVTAAPDSGSVRIAVYATPGAGR